MSDDKPTPKEAAAQRLKESLERINAARKAGTKDFAGKGGKTPKPTSPKGRIFRHQGR